MKQTKSTIKPEDIRTPMQLADYIKQNLSHIYVRAKKDGRWGSFALTEIDSETACKWICTWLKEGRIPYVFKPKK